MKGLVYISCKPLLTALPDMNLSGINWVIAGGESGRSPHPMKEEWVIDIKDQCKLKNVPFYFKQWGGINKKIKGKILNGRVYTEMPQQKFVI